MPDRILPSRHGFLDGINYLLAGFYVFYGLAWRLADPPNKIAYIPWFHETMNDDMIGSVFIVMGAVIILISTFCMTYKGRMVTTVLAFLTSLIPGMLFTFAWIEGYYPRGLVAGVPLLFFALMTLWISRRTSEQIRRDHEELMQARQGGL